VTTQRVLILVTLIAAVLLALFLFRFQSGSTLVDAVATGNVKHVASLIDQGHDINGVGKDDWTPLTIAVENDDSEMVRFLLQNGADPNKIVPGGTALDMALRRQRSDPANLLREFGGRCKTACDLDKER
jgi:ankyrin repeat protein